MVLGNPDPGSANLLPGMLTAEHEGVPVLAITSQHRTGVVYPSTPDKGDVQQPRVQGEGTLLFDNVRIGQAHPP